MEPTIIPGADKCPVCQSEAKAVGAAIDKLKEEGKVPKESFKQGLSIQAVLYDPKVQKILTTTFQTPIIQVVFEACGECHAMYCTSIIILEGTAQVQPGPGMPQHKARPGFRN